MCFKQHSTVCVFWGGRGSCSARRFRAVTVGAAACLPVIVCWRCWWPGVLNYCPWVHAFVFQMQCSALQDSSPTSLWLHAHTSRKPDKQLRPSGATMHPTNNIQKQVIHSYAIHISYKHVTQQASAQPAACQTCTKAQRRSMLHVLHPKQTLRGNEAHAHDSCAFWLCPAVPCPVSARAAVRRHSAGLPQ